MRQKSHTWETKFNLKEEQKIFLETVGFNLRLGGNIRISYEIYRGNPIVQTIM